MWTNRNREKCLGIKKEKEFEKNILEKRMKKDNKEKCVEKEYLEEKA